MSLLKVQNLSIDFKTEFVTVNVIDDISYEVGQKEAVGIVGESGCGKTISSLTTIGLLPPNGMVRSGSIEFGGADLIKLREKDLRKIRGREITMIFQEPMKALDPVYTIGNQIYETLKTHARLTKSQCHDRTIEILKEVDIPNPERIIKNYPHELSGGMKQRVMIAMAMIMHPKLLIADEPTTALDVTIQAQILDLMEKLMHKRDTSIIFITHDMGVVAEFCDKIMVMYSGQIIEKAPKKDIFTNPRHPYTIGLMSSIPRLDEDREVLSYIDGVVPTPDKYPQGCRFSTRCPQAEQICIHKKPPSVKAGNSLVRCWKYAA